ncbi:hypothetical protein HQ865_23985 [Mucilaginibacter mali]|uniref:DUF2007 domain-containing protein n=1 Tax=Mucilaginibacter mali TaxID=2740462 RepID=A0A7D4QXB0_9SPHI|nr:hypothetical protein [Mucilaginibacter mali]QKJ32689.1 hypothetical protein HQ865_23985 [Mucilaginibacter mali]
MPELLTYRKFNDLALANNLAEILAAHHIEYVLEESPDLFNPSFATRTEMSREYWVKISSDDFDRANQVIEAYEGRYADEADLDHYLFGFDDDELMEIINKPDEWSAFDYALAKKILKERGVVIDAAREKEIGEKRMQELKKPEHSEHFWVMVGYFFALFGGVLGFFIGWHLWKSKKTLPNGEQVFVYSPGDRNSGKWIFYLSVVGLIAATYKLYILAPPY